MGNCFEVTCEVIDSKQYSKQKTVSHRSILFVSDPMFSLILQAQIPLFRQQKHTQQTAMSLEVSNKEKTEQKRDFVCKI